ncbi:MAG TPA: alpha/beta fold hydrolase [Streptosporangiaceae bacterium]|jgi:hypothetical protein
MRLWKTAMPGSSSVSFVVDGTTTCGTLDIPVHRDGQRLAAALLIPGSGPTDRNGNDTRLGVTADTLRLIAGILARQGIMTFRYDKYFTGETGAGQFASDPGAITVTSFVRMAEAAYSFLRGQPQADPAKMLIAGHSEGGMIALAVAGSVTGKPAGLALLEPQDVRILDLINLQADEAINNAVAQGKLSVTDARSQGRLVSQAISQFRAGQQVSTTGMAPFLVRFLAGEILTPANARYERSNDEIYPPDLAARVKSGTRVLVTSGTRDPNVPPRTISPLVQALKEAGTTGPGLTLLQGTNHDMHLPGQPDSSPVLAPAVVAAIQQWAQPFAASA